MNESADAAQRGRLRRADKVMTQAEVEAFLEAAYCGRTGTVGADGFPYVVPNLFVWMDGCIYLHTARAEGHFLDNVRHCDRISFEIDELGEVFPYGAAECDTSISYRSVVLFGNVRIIDDDAEKIRFFAAFMTKYAPADSWGRERGSFPRVHHTMVYAITPQAMTGKVGPLPAPAKRWTKTPPATPGV